MWHLSLFNRQVSCPGQSLPDIHAGPHFGDSETEKLIGSMWKNYGCIFAEYIHLDKFRFNKLSPKHIKIIGEENLDRIIKLNKPAIFVSGHFGNFELMAMELEKKGINLAAIYRPLNNFF